MSNPYPPPPSDSKWEQLKKKKDVIESQPIFQQGIGDLPPRQDHIGSDIYFVRPGDSWSSIAGQIYGNEIYRTDLMESNPSRQVLHPGDTLVLPDRREDPRIPSEAVEEFWNTPEFADTVNASEEVRELLPIWRNAEKKWPEHGNIVFLGFDENNEPYPTTDNSGMPLFWDPKTSMWSIEDTGIPYTMGMLENDFIKPLTQEERIELFIMGEQKIQALTEGYYNPLHASGQPLSSVQTPSAYDAELTASWQQNVTEALPQDSAFLPTLHELPQPTPLRTSWWESIIDGIRIFTEEPFRGIANVFGREAEEGDREGLNYFQVASTYTVSLARLTGTGMADAWTDIRALVAGAFGQKLEPLGVDAKTLTKYSRDEIDTLVAQGREDEIIWMDPNNYWAMQVDAAAGTAINLWGHAANDLTGAGIYRDEFESDEEYENYLGGLFSFYPEQQREALVTTLRMRNREDETRQDVLKEKTRLETQAQELLAQGNGEAALAMMTEAKKLELRAAHWYSPYFMWSRLDEPWREEAFLKAVAVAELENQGPLDPRVVRYMRDNYENMGTNITMGIALDVTNFLGAAKPLLRGVSNGLDELVRVFGKGVSAVADKPIVRPVRLVYDWLFSEALSSAGTAYRRSANNMMTKLAQGAEETLSGAVGTQRGLDEQIETLVAAVQGDADALESLPATMTTRWQKAARGLMDMYSGAIAKYPDPDMAPAWLKRINPENWGNLVNTAYDVIHDREFRRALSDLRKSNPELSEADAFRNALRMADEVASKPRLVAQEFGQNFESVWRRLHATELGPETLSDNPLWQLATKLGRTEQAAKLAPVYKLFYGMRNGLFEWWLGLRPGWTAINYIDSTARFLISGGKIQDDIGTLHRVNVKRLLGRDLLRDEFKTTFSRGLREVEGELGFIEPVVDRLLRGRKFKYGLLSLMNDARQEVKAEQIGIRSARGESPLLVKALTWIWDQVAMGRKTISRGFVNTNAIVEFGLRTRVAVAHFDSVYWTMDKFNLDKIVERLVASGATPETISAFKRAWLAGADDVEKSAEFLSVLGGGGRRSERLFSQMLPEGWEEILAKNGVDRRLRSLVFRPVVEDLEDILKVETSVERRLSEIDAYFDEAVEKINAELIDRSNDPYTQGLANADQIPAGAADDVVQVPAAASAERHVPVSGAETRIPDTPEVNLGGGTAQEFGENLNVTTEQFKITDKVVYTMSDEYYRMGELHREAAGRFYDAKRELQTIGAAGGDEATKSVALDNSLSEVRDQILLFRDNLKRFILHVYPGPLGLEPGPLRNAAWEQFDRLGQQIYETVINTVDTSLERVAAGEAAEMPSLSQVLGDAGIETFFENGRLKGIRLTDNAAGTRISFNGWRGTTKLRDQLIKSFFGPNVTIKNAEEFFSQPFSVELVRTAKAARTDQEVAESMAEAFGDAVGRATDRAIAEADAVWQTYSRTPTASGGTIRGLWGADVTKDRTTFITFLEDEIRRLENLGTQSGPRTVLRADELSLKQQEQVAMQFNATVLLGKDFNEYYYTIGNDGNILSRKSIDTARAEMASLEARKTLSEADTQRLQEYYALFSEMAKGPGTGGVHPDTISAIRRLQDEARSLGVTIEQLTLPPEVVLHVARPLPRWMLSDGMHSWLEMQTDLVAQRSAVVRTLEEFRAYMKTGLQDGTLSFTGLPADQQKLVRGVLEDATWRKGAAHDLAMDGSKLLKETNPDRIADLEEMTLRAVGRNDYKGAVKITQDDMLEYANNYRIDSMIKFVSPFWMFQSRSPIFWIRAFSQHPEYLAWWSKYSRIQRKEQIDNGATDSKGRPLNRLFGYVRIPGTDSWVNLTGPLSFKYVLPRPNPYTDADFKESVGPMEEAIAYVYEYGQLFGFRPAPWIALPLYASGVLDGNRYPAGTIISQIDVVVPPWWQRDIRRALRMSRYPNDPGMFTEDVGWQDFMIEKEMFGAALIELQANPDKLPQIQAELYAALGYRTTGVDENGAPIFDSTYRRDRTNLRWTAARDAIEKSQYYNQLLGFFTGIYPKEFTDAEAALLALRDQTNFLKDQINGFAGAAIFGLDPEPESRYEAYSNLRWETPEGFVNQLYGASRWVELPGGGQAYGEERANEMAKRLWEEEVTQAYYDSLTAAADRLSTCQQSNKIGADSAVRRTCWRNYFRERRALDDAPVFDLARRDWAIGYKTEDMIVDRFENLWWSYVKDTQPRWYVEDDEPYANWQLRLEQWKEDLPALGSELAATFLVQEIQPRTGIDGSEIPTEVPGHRIVVEGALVNRLLAQTNAEGYDAYSLKNDTPFDAMNAAFMELQWNPYMEETQKWDNMNTYERALAEQKWLDDHRQLSLPDLQRWVFENYGEDRFLPEDLANVFHAAGVTSIEERNLPNAERGVVENEIWDMLSAAGPGENYKIFQEAFVMAGGEKDLLTAWYETGGNFEDYEKVTQLRELLERTASTLNITPPSQAQLTEWAMAKRLNDDFWKGIENTFGEEFRQTIAVYGTLGGAEKRNWRKAHPELDDYYDMRDEYAKINQLWAKYFNPEKYTTQTGIVGEGAEKRGTASYGDGGGGGSSRGGGSSSFGGGFSGFGERMIGQGYRSTYDTNELADPRILGSGGIAGSPYWPPGFGKNTPVGVLNEIVGMVSDRKPLSSAAIDYLNKVRAREYAEYVKRLMAENAKLVHEDRYDKMNASESSGTTQGVGGGKYTKD